MPDLIRSRGRSSSKRLSGAEVADRVRRWQGDGDEVARQELVDVFLPMARRLANRYHTPGEMDDLHQVASLGLLGAIDRFDPDRGASLVSFAVPTILGEIKRYFRNTAWAAHVPRGAQEMAQRVQRAAHEIESRYGRPPRVSELTEYLEADLEDVLLGLDAAAAHYADSLDAPSPGFETDRDEPSTLADRIANHDEAFGLVELKLSLPPALTCLPYLERRALELRQGSALTQSEIAGKLGCSQMQVSRLLQRAAVRLREQLATSGS